MAQPMDNFIQGPKPRPFQRPRAPVGLPLDIFLQTRRCGWNNAR